MSKRDDFIQKALLVISYIIFIGLCIEAGGLAVNVIVCYFKPNAAEYLYNKLDLSDVHARSLYIYYCLCSFLIIISVLKAYLFYLVINIFTKLNLVKPFSEEMARLITRISYQAFSIFILGCIAHSFTDGLVRRGYDVDTVGQYWDDLSAFLMMAAIVYVIAQVFNKGLELQNENDLTV